MVPLSFPDRRAAFAGAFCARFLARLLRRDRAPAAAADRVRHRRGLLMTTPAAIITNAYPLILVAGIVLAPRRDGSLPGSAHPSRLRCC